ncbi:hypothetical protein [Pseudomonas sp. A34-9]|uniref:hypothetical protein n=1 Tax=Pseudomonas sp. A34-9 TaxID=3034675 RepID=UPI00240DDCA1|nr:hypothetical protein [Pseudomonas sp. A34-9]
MSQDDDFAGEDHAGLFRRWTDCPKDFANTPPSIASRAHQKLFADNVHIEAHKLLSYMRGGQKIPTKDFRAIQAVYMCEFFSDHRSVQDGNY